MRPDAFRKYKRIRHAQIGRQVPGCQGKRGEGGRLQQEHAELKCCRHIAFESFEASGRCQDRRNSGAEFGAVKPQDYLGAKKSDPLQRTMRGKKGRRSQT
jgi:hypothetical protein